MSKREKEILTAIKIITFLIPFSLILVCPTYFCPFNLFFPYITGKAIYFRILVEIAFLLTLLLVFKNTNYLPKKDEYVFWSSVLLVFVMLLLIPFSYRPYLSFWGNAERMEGFWGLLHFFMWFWTLYILFKIEPNFKKTIFYSFLLVFYIISLIEISQKLQGTARPDSTLGNPTYVGFISVLMLFISLYFLKNSDYLEKFLILIGIIFAILNIFISETRGSLVALALAIPVSLLYYFLTSNTKPLTKILVVLLILSLLVSIFIFINTPYAKSLPLFSRLYDTLRDPRAYMARWLAWNIFINAWKQNPIFGYGLENSPIAYFKAFNPEIFNYEEVIFDRPHNKYIEILVTTGIIGAIFWFLFYISIFFGIFKNENDKYLKAVLLGLFIGYLGQNLTLFDIQASYLPFLFGISLVSIVPQKQEEKRKFENIILNGILIGITIFFVIINLFHFYVVAEIINALNSPYPKGLAKFERLISINSNFVPEIANMTGRYLEANIEKIRSVEEANRFTKIFLRALMFDPYDTRVFNLTLLHLSRLINAKQRAGLDISLEKDIILKLYKNYAEFYPDYPDIQMDYAKTLQALGEKEKAIEILEKVKQKYRESPRVIFLLANLYYMIDEKEKAFNLIEETLARRLYPENQVQYLIVLRILKDRDNEKFNQILNDYKAKFNDTSSLEILNKTLSQ